MPFPKLASAQRALSKVAVALWLAGLAAHAADGTRVSGYDFGYVSSGDVRATPVQVFDDGRNTYFQFRAGEIVPAIFSSRTGMPQLVIPVQEGPYIKVADVHGRFILQAGRSQAQVIHSRGTRPDAPVLSAVSASGVPAPYAGGMAPPGGQLLASLAPAAPPLVDDALNRNSYATPTRGDKVMWTEGEPRRDELQVWFRTGSAALSPEARKTISQAARASSSRFIVVGRDDDTYKEGLDKQRAQAISDALREAGISADRISSRVGIAGKSRGKNLWGSNLIVETERPDVMTMADGSGRGAQIRGNLAALVRAGVLRSDQANAILQHHTREPAPTSLQPTAATQPPAASPAVLAAQPAHDAPPGGFTLVAADKTIQGTLRRWASQLNYQLVWEAPQELDAPVVGALTIPAANLQEALNRLLGGLKTKGYALDATVYANRVIRLTAATASAGPAQPPAAAPADAGRPVEPAPERKPQRPTLASQEWQMLAKDRDVQQMLSRWAADAKWTLVWNSREQIRILDDAKVTSPNFKSAAEQVIADAKRAGYRLQLSAPDEKTLVVSSY